MYRIVSYLLYFTAIFDSRCFLLLPLSNSSFFCCRSSLSLHSRCFCFSHNVINCLSNDCNICLILWNKRKHISILTINLLHRYLQAGYIYCTTVGDIIHNKSKFLPAADFPAVFFHLYPHNNWETGLASDTC